MFINFILFYITVYYNVYKRILNMGVGSGGPWPPPWVFIHDTYIVDRGLKVLFFGVFLLFFGLFSVAPFPPGRGVIVLIFRSYFPLPLSSPPPKVFLPTLLILNVYK